MKKYFFGLLAVVLAISLSSFTATKKEQGKTYSPMYWFRVIEGHGDQAAFLDSELEFTGTYGTPTNNPTVSICSTVEDDYKCVIGFNPGDVDAGGVLDDSGGPLEPADIKQYRDSDEARK